MLLNNAAVVPQITLCSFSMTASGCIKRFLLTLVRLLLTDKVNEHCHYREVSTRTRG